MSTRTATTSALELAFRACPIPSQAPHSRVLPELSGKSLPQRSSRSSLRRQPHTHRGRPRTACFSRILACPALLTVPYPAFHIPPLVSPAFRATGFLDRPALSPAFPFPVTVPCWPHGLPCTHPCGAVECVIYSSLTRTPLEVPVDYGHPLPRPARLHAACPQFEGSCATGSPIWRRGSVGRSDRLLAARVLAAGLLFVFKERPPVKTTRGPPSVSHRPALDSMDCPVPWWQSRSPGSLVTGQPYPEERPGNGGYP